MNNNKRMNSSFRENRLTVYLSKEAKQQLLFVCQLKDMPISELCRKILQNFLKKKNIEQLMIEYALKHIQQAQKKEN